VYAVADVYSGRVSDNSFPVASYVYVVVTVAGPTLEGFGAVTVNGCPNTL
jgi:hypothetical protein